METSWINTTMWTINQPITDHIKRGQLLILASFAGLDISKSINREGYDYIGYNCMSLNLMVERKQVMSDPVSYEKVINELIRIIKEQVYELDN